MRFTADKEVIKQMLVDRVHLEQEVARELSRIFATGALSTKLNFAVRRAFTFVKQLKSQDFRAQGTIVGLEKGNDFLFHTTPKSVEGVLAEFGEGKKLTPAQCGNLIRFYGEVVEKYGATNSEMWKRERAKQISWRYGGGGEAFKAQQDPTYEAKADVGSVWQKKTSAQFPQGGRIRTKAFDKDKDGNVTRDYFKGQVNPYYDLIPGNTFNTDASKNLAVGKKFGGVMVWKVEDSSTIGKIDRVFGLPYGADISGTTTDNMYFITGWADMSTGDKLPLMLPLAAIIGEYHHSLLEVAGAMTLKKVIGYQIGFYKTLVPTLGSDARAEEQRGDVERALAAIESKPENKHLVLYYTGKQIGGAYIAEGDELDAFRRLATIDIRLWPKFGRMAEYPNEEQILALLNEVGLGGAAFAARRGALRGGAAQGQSEEARLRARGLPVLDRLSFHPLVRSAERARLAEPSP